MNPIQMIKVRVPATSANLGPGFDTLGLALDLWNETSFELAGKGIRVLVTGRGEQTLPIDANNHVVRAFQYVFKHYQLPLPEGVKITCNNHIPLSSGMGSSASAVLTGLLGAAAMLPSPPRQEEILTWAAALEGHADNAAAGLLGGLTVIVTGEDGKLLTRRYDMPQLQVVVIIPEINLSTTAARAVLPSQVSLKDAVFNLSRTVLVVEALHHGDLELLRKVLQDRLHQPHRLPHIPGASHAIQAALDYSPQTSAALSGAGPGVIAFTDCADSELVAKMKAGFTAAGIPCEALILTTTNHNAQVELVV